MRSSWLIAAAVAMGCAGLSSCALLAPPAPPRHALPPVAPFDEAPVSFVIAGPHFTPGEVTIVKVCIADDRSVVSADILESSGDRRFDDYAVQWAQRVRVRSASPTGRIDRCGEVRVEIRRPSEPRVIAGPDGALS